MKGESKKIDYAIYIDHKVSFIISLKNGKKEDFISEKTEHKEGNVEGNTDVNQQLHIQNKKNEQLKKFCKTIVKEIKDTRSILIFGPAEQKFQLRKKIEHDKNFKKVHIGLVTTEYMDKEQAKKFALNEYSASN